MQHLNILAFAVPLFTGLMLLEYAISRKKQKKIFEFSDTIANLNIGIAERLSDLITTGSFYFFFHWIHAHFAILDIRPAVQTWILLFLFTDLLWYFYHRFGHSVNILWAAHVVHHQSEEFNYSVSVRITVFQAAARCVFWSFLPLIGFPAEMIILILLFHGAYPFFTHTRLVGNLGWLEYILVTPSHHRIHHSSNAQYLDKNFGDVLIIWDKLFGTFAKEEPDVPPVYGLTKPLKSYSFLWQHFHFWLELYVSFMRAKGMKAKLRVLFGKPDDIDPGIRDVLERRWLLRNTESPVNRYMLNYIKFQTLTNLAVLFLLILFEHQLTRSLLYTGAVFVIISAIATGAMLEKKQWIFHMEFSRLLIVGMFICFCVPGPVTLTLTLTFLMVILAFYRSISASYYRVLYSPARV